MDENQVVFDISSDEEPAFGEPEGDDYSWLSKLLCDEVENSDDVVVVGEIKSKSSKVAVKDEDDDDCIVLEGDPEKDVSADSDQAEEDDLVVVGHKGQVACRDYPHSRHLCAKFAFRSTAHELHCDLCHCYVCDVVSPCAYWGTGASVTDHCHATEKDEYWRNQRKEFRIQKDPNNSLSDTAFSQLNQAPPDITQLAPTSLPQIQVSRPAIIPPSNTRFSTPNIISHSRIRHSQFGNSRNRFPTHSVSQQSSLLRARNTVIFRDRTPHASNLGVIRRSGMTGGVLPMSQPMYGSANNTGGVHALQCDNNPAPRATSNDEINVRWVPGMHQDSCTYQSFSQTGTGSVLVNTVPSQPQVYSHQIPQTQVYSQPVPQPPVYSQPITQPLVYSQPTPELQACSQSLPQSHIYTNRISQSSDGQNINEFGIQRQNSTGPEFSDLDMLVNVSGSNQQTNELLPVGDFNSHCNGNAKLHYSDPEYDSWYPENHSVHLTDGYAPATFEAGWAYTLSDDLF